MPHYREPLYRPPSEADSLIFQVAYGCPHNTCLFCPMYKGVRYELRNRQELFKEIEKASGKYRHAQRIFLADGDVMALSYDALHDILKHLNIHFPNIARISAYSNGSSILAKSESELKNLRALKLHTLYMGLESGDDQLLGLVKKGETAQDMTRAVHAAQSAGLRMCVFALLGLGGRNYSESHARKTAEIINLMSPRFFAVLRFIQAPWLKMFDGYDTLSEYESIEELHRIISGLNLEGTIFRADHTSVPVPLSARFPKDKESLLALLKTIMDSSNLDKKGIGIVSPCL